MEDIIAQKIKNFWIIDDDRIFSLLSRRVIEISGITENIQLIPNAESALQEIHALVSSGKQLPEVIFLDINMPEMSGFEFLSRLEEIPQSVHTNVYVFSAIITQEDRKKTFGYKLVKNIIEKPLTIEKLKLIVSQL